MHKTWIVRIVPILRGEFDDVFNTQEEVEELEWM